MVMPILQVCAMLFLIYYCPVQPTSALRRLRALGGKLPKIAKSTAKRIKQRNRQICTSQQVVTWQYIHLLLMRHLSRQILLLKIIIDVEVNVFDVDVEHSTWKPLRETFYVKHSTCNTLRETFYVKHSTSNTLRVTLYVKLFCALLLYPTVLRETVLQPT